MEIEEILKIPDIFIFDRFLIFEPHPDDADIFIGGIIKKLSNMKKDVILVTVTDGSKGTYNPLENEYILKEKRKEERLNSSFILGVKETIFLDFQDYNLPDKTILVEKFIKLIRELKPDCVFTVDPFLTYEIHPDHKITGEAASEAFFFSPMPLFYKNYPPHYVKAIVYYITQYPNNFIDVSDTFDFKIEAIKKHKSQFNEEDFMKLKLYLIYKNGEYGKKIEKNFAEAVKVLTPLHIHTNVDTINL
ncbi:MAG: PIG-L deacetylase family protein [Caldisericia bacterium]